MTIWLGNDEVEEIAKRLERNLATPETIIEKLIQDKEQEASILKMLKSF